MSKGASDHRLEFVERSYHKIVGTLEYIPVIGSIVALLDAGIGSIFGSKPGPLAKYENIKSEGGEGEWETFVLNDGTKLANIEKIEKLDYSNSGLDKMFTFDSQTLLACKTLAAKTVDDFFIKLGFTVNTVKIEAPKDKSFYVLQPTKENEKIIVYHKENEKFTLICFANETTQAVNKSVEFTLTKTGIALYNEKVNKK
ncbi:MAG: hypothetical protein V4489_03915 [Chlamydiota bacterium]